MGWNAAVYYEEDVHKVEIYLVTNAYHGKYFGAST